MQTWHVHRAIGAALMIAIVVASVVGLAYFQDEAVNMVNACRRPYSARMDCGGRQSASALDKVQAAAKVETTTTASPGTNRRHREPLAFRLKRRASSQYLWSSSFSVGRDQPGHHDLVSDVFMLPSDELFKRKLVEMAGPTLAKKKIGRDPEDIAQQIERFLVIEVVTSVVVAVATGLALWAMGLHEAAFWGFLAGVFNSIPHYGPLTVTGGLSIVVLQFGTILMTAAIAGVALLITTLEGGS